MTDAEVERRHALRDAYAHAERSVIGRARTWANADRASRKHAGEILRAAVSTYERLALAVAGTRVQIEALDLRCSACDAIALEPCRGPHHGNFERRTERGFINWEGWHLAEPHPARAALAALFSVSEVPQICGTSPDAPEAAR